MYLAHKYRTTLMFEIIKTVPLGGQNTKGDQSEC